MPFIQITIAEGHDVSVKRDLLAAVSAAAADATGTPESAFRGWLVEVPDTAVMVGGTILHDTRHPRATP
ncbi:tautomerase family protein [Amycolatopsis sp. FDAARGOS 1241]|uniref:tautomerase family protein n=1 Tax=Amycolatopsis sp. FDAARGOS 1241 TaxID=2778070 RepID=UPI00195259CE|nr:tautomerase family protein [Amycolatopsis sp. FDAARGOS 1241]QRP48856.1 tautomerase family protein [Amycolatopsis sp. FDAARGOS 1241]